MTGHILPPLPPQPGGLVIFSPAQWRWIGQAFQTIHSGNEVIISTVGPFTTALESLMASAAELQVSLDALTAADAENAQRTSDELAQLQAALAAITPGEPVSQAQLDQVNAVVAAMTARNASLAADDAPPTP